MPPTAIAAMEADRLGKKRRSAWTRPAMTIHCHEASHASISGAGSAPGAVTSA